MIVRRNGAMAFGTEKHILIHEHWRFVNSRLLPVVVDYSILPPQQERCVDDDSVCTLDHCVLVHH